MGTVTERSNVNLTGSSTRVAKVAAVAIVEDVASTLRHDLRNKLAAIRNAVFYVERSLTKSQTIHHDPRVGRFLHLVAEQLDAADALLDQQQLHAAASSGTAGPVPLAQCVRGALCHRAIPEGVTVATEVDAYANVLGDPDEVTLVLDCLLDNAFEAVGHEGAVTIRSEEEAGVTRVRIVDTGPGMNDEQRERAVKAFASDKPGHAGLGLTIAARIARRLGGKLELEDQSGGSGAVCVLSLPKAS